MNDLNELCVRLVNSTLWSRQFKERKGRVQSSYLLQFAETHSRYLLGKESHDVSTQTVTHQVDIVQDAVIIQELDQFGRVFTHRLRHLSSVGVVGPTLQVPPVHREDVVVSNLIEYSGSSTTQSDGYLQVVVREVSTKSLLLNLPWC